jgi:PAS domain S-box-containing protein
MRLNPRLLRARLTLAARLPILRYGVAILSIILALIPTLLLPGVIESRLVVFAVAVMVSAWYGGWKPGLVATSFALTVSAYFSLTAARVPADYGRAITHLTLFVVVALLICWFNAALRSAQQGMRQSESNFRSLVTNAPYGICRCDSAGMLLDVNPALVTILGYASSSELIGRNLANLYADSQHWFTLADYFRSQQRFNDLLAEWVRQDGSLVNVCLSGSAIPSEDNLFFFELFIEDVSERRVLEQQLRQAQKMEAVGRLAGGIAHDFNNLLMVVSGYCEFLLERIGSERALSGPVQEIANAAERATSLTRQLLAFSRKQMLAPKVLNLNTVVEENLNMLRRVIGEDIHLVMLPSAELGAVKADPGQMEQVIMNLAVNARDAMPRGGGLTIETANVTLDQEFARLHAPVAPGEYVMLAISDTGMGMDAATQAKIFEPFFTTKGPKGTGLGLSTVYGIIQQSGGHIEVSSELGKGASFKIFLPRVSATGQPIATEPVVAAAKPEQAQGTILLVEDESNLRNLVREYLEKQGHTVVEAGDGAAAIKVANVYRRPIHLLLTDVVMPGMSGRELANRLSALRPEIKVLYMSGYSEDAIGQNAKLEKEIVLLQKPFNLAVLQHKVQEALERTRPQGASAAIRFAEQAQTATQDNLPSSIRAQRFNLHVPLKYRLVGQVDWREGNTENISRSGMLFRAQELVPLRSQLEINLVLPWQIAGLAATEVVCRGEVVRALERDQFTTSHALAAKILRYQFQPRSQQPQA